MTRTGSPYLALELRDRTGTVPARAFRDADVARRAASSAATWCGSPAGSSGSATSSWSRSPTSRARSGEGDGVDPAAVPAGRLPRPRRARRLPRAPRARGLRRPLPRPCSTRCSADRELRAAWRRAPCTRAGHHAYLGGLLEHTVAVGDARPGRVPAAPAAELRPAADGRARPRPRPNPRVHLRRRDRADRRGPAARPPRDRAADAARARRRALDEERRLALLHCVLCHHGAGVGAGGRFGSAEALALYRINALDAGVKGALEHGLGP